MVITIKLTLDKDRDGVFVDSKILDFQKLHELTVEVINNGNTLTIEYENFDDVPDLKAYYTEIFDAINGLVADPEIVDLNQQIAEISKE